MQLSNTMRDLALLPALCALTAASVLAQPQDPPTGLEPRAETISSTTQTVLLAGEIEYLLHWRSGHSIAWSNAQAAGGSSDLFRGLLSEALSVNEARLVHADSEIPSGWLLLRTDSGIVSLPSAIGRGPNRTTLAVSDLSSPVETDAALMANADDGIRVWVNGELATTKSEHEELKFHYRFARVHLKKGTNRIVAKLVYMGPLEKKGKFHWRFAVALTSLENARKEKAAHTVLNGITTPLIGKDAKLGLDLTLFERERPVSVELFNHSHEPLKTLQLEGGKRQSPVLSDLPDGLYYCTLGDSIPSDELAFYKGDPGALFQEYRKRSAALLNDPNVAALVTRYEHLNKSENKRPADRIWQAKIVGTFTEWNEILRAVEQQKDAYVDVPGTHTRGFRSPIDGQVQHYIVHVPVGYKRTSDRFRWWSSCHISNRRSVRFSKASAWRRSATIMSSLLLPMRMGLPTSCSTTAAIRLAAILARRICLPRSSR